MCSRGLNLGRFFFFGPPDILNYCPIRFFFFFFDKKQFFPQKVDSEQILLIETLDKFLEERGWYS